MPETENKIRPHTEAELRAVESQYEVHPFFLKLSNQEKERQVIITTRNKTKIYQKLQCSSCGVLPKVQAKLDVHCLAC